MKVSRVLLSIMLVVLALSSSLALTSSIGVAEEEPRILERTMVYTLPYVINFNPWAPANTLGLAWLGTQPLFYFLPNNQLYIPALAKKAILNPEEMYVEIELWDDNYWNHQGELVRPVDARDVWTVYTIHWKIMRNWVQQIQDIEIVDDFKIRFYLSKIERSWATESPYVDNPAKKEHYEYTSYFQYYSVYGIFGWWLSINAPYEIFGSYAEMVADVPVDRIPQEFNLTQLQEEIRAIQLEDVWCNGPYWLDVSTITPEGVILRKNPGWRYSDRIPWDEVHYKFVGAEEHLVNEIIQGNELVGMPGFSIEILSMIQEESEDIKVIYAWNFEVHGLVFNINRYPYNITEFRQALAMLIDRVESANAFPPIYVPYTDYPTSISSTVFFPDWITENLRNWTYNPTEAYELLEEAGFQRGADGYWRTPDGQEIKIEFLVTTAAYGVPWQALGLNLQSQLEAHGIKSEIVSVDPTVYWTRVGAGDYDVMITWSASGYESLCMLPDGLWGMLYGAAAQAELLNWTWPVPLPNGTTIYVCPNYMVQIVTSAIPGTKEWMDAIAKVTWWYNYYLPTISLWAVRRPFYFDIKEMNIFDYLGEPESWFEMAGASFPYYGRLGGLMITWVYPTNYWIALGMIQPPTTPQWPPTGSAKPIWELLPPEVEEGVFDIIEFFAELGAVEEEVPEEVPTEIIAQLESRIEELNATMLNIQSTIDDLQSRIDDLESQIATIQIETLTAQIETLTDKVSDFESQLSNVATAVSSIQSIAYASIGIAVIALIVAILAIVRPKGR